MGIREFFSSANDVIEAIKKIVDNDEFGKKLDNAGGLIALVGIGIDLYQQIKDNLDTPRKKAFAALLNIAFESAEELLGEINDRFSMTNRSHFERIPRKEKKDLMNHLLDTFIKESDWDSYLPDHPAIIGFRSQIVSLLNNQGYDYEAFNYFIIKFSLKLENKAKTDEDIKKFYDWWTSEEQYKELVEYLEYLRSHRYYVKRLDQKPLYEYYVEQDAIPAAGATTWDLEYTDKELVNEPRRSINEIIRDFLEEDERWYIVIGAPFGIGKTSMARMIASSYASRFLYADKTAITSKDNARYIPILVFLENGIEDVYHQKDLDLLLDEIVAPNEEAKKRRILLILDGIDEFSDQTPETIGKMFNDNIKKGLRNKYPNIKVIITTRLKAGFAEQLKINDYDNKYVRLLPFTIDQVNQFFERYGVNIKYDDLIECGLKEEEITKPLLAWMISRTPEIIENLRKVKIREEQLPTNMTKSLIYLIFFHYIITGKPVDPTTREDEEIISKYYINEKKFLRFIAILKQIYGKDLTKKIIEQTQNKFNLAVDTQLLNSVLSSYFYLKSPELYVDFVHETFKEYLLAEHYLWCLIDKNSTNQMYITTSGGEAMGIPNPIVIGFLEGLLGLVNTKNENVRKFLESKIIKIGLLKSFEFKGGLDGIKKQLIENIVELIKQDQIDLFSINEETTKSIVVSRLVYESFGIHKWISLYALNRVNQPTNNIDKQGLEKLKEFIRNNIDKQGLEKLIRFNSRVIPYSLKKLDFVDLSSTDLANTTLSNASLYQANLSRTALSNTDLSCANLSESDLSYGTDSQYAILSNANLSYANLTYANLSHSMFSKANLSNATLTNTDLSYANLSEAHLEYSDLTEAKLPGASLSEADLSYAKATYANFTRANLFKAKLLHCDLNHANFSEADFSTSILSNSKLSYAHLFSSTFYRAKLDDCNLSSAYMARGNFSEADFTSSDLSNTNLSYSILSKANLSYSILSKANLSYANLSDAILVSSRIGDSIKYDGVICTGADFRNAKIEDKEFIKYLQKNGAINVPS